MKKIFGFCLLILILTVFGRGWYWVKDGFHIARIRTAFQPAQNPPIDPELLAAFDKPYRYVGRGRQCYAFTSEDDRYILKLPRLDRYELPFYARATFAKHWDDLLHDHTSRREFLLKSFQIAGNELKEETGTLYLHLNQSDHLKKKVQLIDKIGRRYTIDLDHTAFILQEKHPILLPAFKQALSDGNEGKAKEILEAFLVAVANRAKKGILNKDASFRRNYGYDGKHCIQIDIGSFYYKSELANPALTSFKDTTDAVQQWLNGYNPEIAEWFQDRCDKIARIL